MKHPKGSQDKFDVAIIGYGPTGATLGNLLVRAGLSVVVLEREAEAYHLPRAVHLDDEVMRVFQTIGIADEFVRETFVNLGMRFVDAAGTLLMDWPRPQEVSPNGWHASYRFHQPKLEEILRNALSRYAEADIRTQCVFETADEQDDYVLVQYNDLKEKSSKSVKARYVVGCDGANSPIRHLIDPEMEDFGFEERWLVVDVILKRPMPELGDHTIQYCNPDRPATYCRSPGMRRRWEIRVLEDEIAENICKPDAVWGLLKDWLTPEDADIERQAVYTFRSAIAKEWRKGRLLIAGDAAHLTPPFMGQGMCAGIRDSSNLAWKIIDCINADASDEILDSYKSERYAHVMEYIRTAIHLGGVINSMATEEALKSAFTQSDGSVKMESIKPKLGVGLGDVTDEFRGTLFPQPNIFGDQQLDDYTGYKPWLLTQETLEKSILPKGLTLVVAEKESELCQWLLSTGLFAVLVRPDRYVLGTARTMNGVPLLLTQLNEFKILENR